MRLTLSEAFAALQVPKDASPELVRQSYRQLALRCHPDKNPSADATAAFQRVSAAYKRICDHREQQQKREASSGSPFFFGASEEECDDDNYSSFEGDMDDDISLQEMLFMFQMMFDMPSKEKRAAAKHGARSGRKSQASSQTAASNQTAGGKTPGVSVNIGGRRRRGKGKRKARHSHGRDGLDRDLAGMEEEMARMFMADPFAFHADELDSDEDAELLKLARVMMMGGRPAMRDLFGARRPGERDNNAVKGGTHRPGESAEKNASAPVSRSVSSSDASESNNSAPTNDPIEVGTCVQVYGRLSGVVKFVGQVHYAKGEFVGVELLDAEGKNSGVVKGVQYFSCAPGRGLMVRPTDVVCALSA